MVSLLGNSIFTVGPAGPKLVKAITTTQPLKLNILAGDTCDLCGRNENPSHVTLLNFQSLVKLVIPHHLSGRSFYSVMSS